MDTGQQQKVNIKASLVLIVSSTYNDQTMLEQAASEDPAGHKYTFTSTASFGQETEWWIENQPDLLVISLPPEVDLQQLFIDRMQEVLPSDIRLMIVTPEVTPSLLKLSNKFSDLRMLKGPVAGPSFFKAIHDFITYANPTARQRHQRHTVHINCRVQSLGAEGDAITGVAKNISIGGAYIESDSRSNLSAEDRVNVTFFLGEMAKEYQLEARIVWTKPHGNGMAMGVNFIVKQDLYETLLANF
ncbi:MAG: PilZ domain-containing protein [Pseudobdellovibrionaceae bacterium]